MGSSLNLFSLTIVLIYFRIPLSVGEVTTQSDGSQQIRENKPNIVIILADDMGFNDVSIHGSNQIPTPNIDALGIMGIQLNQMYVAPMCTPSRSSLLTGKYESNLGMQHSVILPDEPFGLDPQVKTIAEYMRSGGYRTHLIGKWHLGYYEKQYTPLYRGFDSHFGYLGSHIDYFNHSLSWENYSSGYDMRTNLDVSWDTIGHYATDLFTEKAEDIIENHNKSMPMFLILSHLAPHAANDDDPLQAPEAEINKFNYIRDENRRVYVAMVSKLDESVGRIVKTLDENDMLANTIILFMSDNGAQVTGIHANFGSNFPLKGQKSSPWQGGIRSAAAIWSTKLKRRQRVSNQMIHISDWLPTFAKIAGVNVQESIDGIDVWDALSDALPSPRKEILVHHDEATPYMAFISDNFKLVLGSPWDGIYDRWLSEPLDPSQENSTFGCHYSSEILSSEAGQMLSKYSKTNRNQFRLGVEIITKEEIDEIRLQAQVTCNGHTPPDANSTKACNALESPCLFDILNDPCETTNLASKFPDIVMKLKERLDYYGSIAKPIRNRPADPRCDPADFGGIWTWWYDELNVTAKSSASASWRNSEDILLMNLICFFVCYNN